jgi:DedD protein
VEKATKERLTGAVIFAALVAIAVPELLSGPSDAKSDADAARGVVADTGPPLATYDLTIDPAAKPAAARQQGLAVPAADEQSQAIAQAVPPPVTEPPKPVAPIPAPETSVTPATPPPSQPAASPSRTAPPAASGGWWVQVGSFASGENAQRLARDLRGKGFAIEVATVTSGGKQLYRVRAGPEQDRTAAVALRTRLAAAGQQGSLVAP